MRYRFAFTYPRLVGPNHEYDYRKYDSAYWSVLYCRESADFKAQNATEAVFMVEAVLAAFTTITEPRSGKKHRPMGIYLRDEEGTMIPFDTAPTRKPEQIERNLEDFQQFQRKFKELTDKSSELEHH